MAKTEIILLKSVDGLGGESDQVTVALGYARNYLIPQGYAIPLTGANQRRIEALRKRRATREAHELTTMSEIGDSLNRLVLVLTVNTSEEGKMFGSVTASNISEELKRQFEIDLDRRKIHLERPIRTLGDHEIEFRLHPKVTTHLKVRVNSSTPLPEPPPAPATAEAAEPKADDKKARRRKPRTKRSTASEE